MKLSFEKSVLCGWLAFAAIACPLHIASAGKYKPGDVFKDCDDCPSVVVVPARCFMMGPTDKKAVFAR